MFNYTYRTFTVDEAAALAGMKRATLDVWVHREPAELFSERRGSRRYFSARDICVLKIAGELERGGMVLLTAIAAAFERLQKPPPADAILVLKNGAVSPRSGAVMTAAQVREIPITASLQLVPIGYFTAGILAAIEKETP